MTSSRELVQQRSSRELGGGAEFDEYEATMRSLGGSIRGPSWIGWLLVLSFLGGFGLWAGAVDLAGGAIASGIISPEGNRKTVQHLEGGIIARLHVQDGDTVTRGQPLLELESLQPRANHDALQSQQRALNLTRVRLEAERQGASDMPAMLQLVSGDAQARRVFEGQRELLLARREAHLARKRIQMQRIEQFQEQIGGYRAQVKGVDRQLELIADELEGKRALYKKGLLTKPVMRQLERAEAELGGRRGEYQAAIARAHEQIMEARLQLNRLDAERLDQIATDLEKVQLELVTTEEKLRTSADVLARTTVTAPVAGRVVNLKFKAERGVVQPGVAIMDVVPSEDTLLIDARISPGDIEVVHPGLKAQVQLTAFSSRTTPRVAGVVRTVSADRLVDEQSRQPYFLARVEVDRAELAAIGRNLELLPGMPADVLIVTGQRTLAQYLLQPFLDAVWRSFREV